MTSAHRLAVAVSMMLAVFVVVSLANLFELPVLGLCLLGALVGGTFGASARLGRWRLHRWASRLDEPEHRAEALRALEAMAISPWRVQPVGVDAHGYVALERLEQGDLGGALVHARTIRLRSLRRERRRTPDSGFLGEVVASVLGRLFPEVGLEVTPSSSFRASTEGVMEPAPRRFLALLAALRVLEAVDQGEPGPVLRAYNEMGFETLRRDQPLLADLVWAAAAQIEPALEDGLAQEVHELDARRRAVVLRRFPALRDQGDAAYRVPAPVSVEPREITIRSAPGALMDLVPSPLPSRWLPIVPRWTRALGWFFVGQAVASVVWLGEPFFVIMASAFGPMLVGSAYHRRARIGPLLEPGITDPVRVRELRRMRTRAAPQRSDLARLHPFERGEIMLVVGLYRAERALAEGDADEARAQVSWWIGGADETTVRRFDPVALGASLIRVAALLRIDEAATRMAVAFEPGTGWIERRRRRSGHGDAPQALAFARALMHAVARRWHAAARALREAAGSSPVELDAFERGLYCALLRRVAAEGHDVPPVFEGLAARSEPRWVRAVWPVSDQLARAS